MRPMLGLVLTGTLAICLQNAALGQRYTVLPGPKDPDRTPTRPPTAQPPLVGPQDDNKTDVSVELIMNDNAGALTAQEWSRVFRELKVPVRIRRGLPDEKPEVREQQVGTLRFVTVIGNLDRSGDLVFADRRYSRSDIAKLGEWLRELDTFGAQGSPKGKPLWGLSKEQFGAIYDALAEPLPHEVADLSLSAALAGFSMPREYPLRMSAAAAQWLNEERSLPQRVRQEVKGFSKGTALALVLNNFGLGFRPQRTPSGSLELVIDPLKEGRELWHVGWEPKERPVDTSPKLFEMVPVQLENVRLVEVLDTVSAHTGLPIRYDDYRLAVYDIDLENLRVSYPARRTAWFIVLRGLTNPVKLSHELRIDEQGRPFIWISTLKIGEFGR